ncbi:MAG: Pr6Pr family membrane protein [Mycobacteriales bacterium]
MSTPRTRRRRAVTWHAATAVVVVVGLVWQLVLIIRGVNVLVDSAGALPSVATRIVRFFSFFTVESNILVAITAVTLAVAPLRDGRVWRVLRLEALFGITVTGIVYATLLRGVVDLHGAAAVTNALLHYAAPLMAVLGWLLVGPRPRIEETTLVLSLIWPALYVGYSFAHGAATGWYPYPFIDVTQLGYVTVVRNGVGLILLLVGVGAVYLWLDRRLRVSR